MTHEYLRVNEKAFDRTISTGGRKGRFAGAVSARLLLILLVIDHLLVAGTVRASLIHIVVVVGG